ncbi:MAG TPA: ATP-binding protein, partial [Pyrinomonadaceae bacterium]|nr:ATP-binding protein [Pyrinomonadaceae bacterium]
SPVERAVEAVRPLIDQYTHEFSISLPPKPIWILADSTRLEQVIENLLNNAAKYTDEGGHIWLSVVEEENEAVLRVRDTGVGIDPEMLPRMFELFSQAERTLDRSQGGLGIGLYLAQRLVQMHGGTIEAHSAGLEQGSEFTVRLPVAREAAPKPASSKMELKAPRPLRVLVVDDNVDTAESMAILLSATGHESRVAHSGETALEAAFEYQPNIVLLDIGLPGMNGYEVAKQLRQHPQTKNATLIAVTGYGQDVDRQHSQKAGFDHHLVKPADFAKLEELLATLTRQEHPGE